MTRINVTWINMPPIREMSAEGLDDLCWKCWEDWDSVIDPIIDLERISSVGLQAFEEEMYFVYMLLGKPVGLASISTRRGNHGTVMSGLVTHPGTKSGGGILVEHVVNWSERAGNEGCVELIPRRGWEDSFRLKGFVESPSVGMKLIPRESDKWVQLGQEWRLKQHSVRSPLDRYPWRRLIVEAQLGDRVPRQNFGFLNLHRN